MLTHFKAHAQLFFSGNLCGDAVFGDDKATGFLHLLRRGTVKLHDATGFTTTLNEPTLLFYSRPLAHSFLINSPDGADLVCASMRFEHAAFNPISFALPARFLCPLRDFKGGDTLPELLFREAFDQKPGRQDVLDRLFEVMLIDVLRIALSEKEGDSGWLRSLLHPQLGKALHAIHTDPTKDWSIDALAQLASMSRSSFTATFKTEIGDSPAITSRAGA